MTIHDIVALTKETSPYFFDPKTLKFFGQTVSGFRVKKMDNGRYRISQPMKDRFTKRVMGETVRYFNPVNNELEKGDVIHDITQSENKH